MIEHLVLFKYESKIDKEIKEQIIKKFNGLLGVIPGLLEVSIGENITEETNFAHGVNIGLRMLFQSHDDLRAYLLHPVHLKIAEIVTSSVEYISVCDFYI